MQTYFLFVKGQHDIRSIHLTNADQAIAHTSHRHCSAFVYLDSNIAHESDIVTSYCIDYQ